MNPFVEVQGTEGDPASFTTDALREYDLVVCAGVPLSTARLLAGRCREAGVKFACGDCRGTFGWYVLDLGDHGFVVQVPVQGKDEKTLVEVSSRSIVDIRAAWVMVTPAAPCALLLCAWWRCWLP